MTKPTNDDFETRPCAEVLDTVTSELFAVRADRANLIRAIKELIAHQTFPQDVMDLVYKIESRTK